MPSFRESAEEFLAQRRIAVAGVSRDANQPANLIYRRLRATGHEVFAVNPNAETVEGEPAFATVRDIPGGVDGVVVVTPPGATVGVVADCVTAGVPRVWIHRGLGPGSSSPDAVALALAHGLAVIPRRCPNMVGATSDAGHRCLRTLLMAGGRIPRRVPTPQADEEPVGA